ncbi:MAG TPA: hypothetical protein P5055_23515, partial [Candidatus Paceibacterota bacterium]|nr:hypothetical protein [Candidatus Paceibacterota bacterium]
LDEQVTLSVECLDRLYLKGHEWAKRQLEKEGIDFEALDNGFWRGSGPVKTVGSASRACSGSSSHPSLPTVRKLRASNLASLESWPYSWRVDRAYPPLDL